MLGKTKLLACASIAALAMAVPAMAAPKTSQTSAPKAPSNQELLERIEKLESQQQKSKDTIDKQRSRITVLEDKSNEVQWSLDNGRPQVKSGDGRFSMAIRARFQADFAAFQQSKGLSTNGDLSSGANVRRAYFGVEGKVFRDFWYEFRLNFGGGNGIEATDSYLNIARVMYTGIPHVRINVGIIEPVFAAGLNVSSGALMFLERDPIDNAAAGAFGGADGRHGIEVSYFKENMFRSGDNLIASAALTGAQTGKPTSTALNQGHGPGGDEQAQVMGRLAYRIWSNGQSNLQVGATGARILNPAGQGKTTPATLPSLGFSDRPGVRVDGTSLVSITVPNIDNATMWGYDAEMNWRNFYLGGEYQRYEVKQTCGGAVACNPGTLASPHFSGWYVEGSWIITGESKPYNATAMNNELGSWSIPKVTKPFSLDGHSWGAWEIAARYSTLDLNNNPQLTGGQGGFAGGTQNLITIGVNWYLNNNVRIMVNDIIGNIEKRSATGVSNNLSGQNLNIVAARLQFQM